MKNKILVKLIIPEIDDSFDLFIPVNELIWKIKKLILRAVNDMSMGAIDLEKEYVLINKATGQVYTNNISVRETDIRNASEIYLISLKNS